jgi:sugar lactone lactonase YvrE
MRTHTLPPLSALLALSLPALLLLAPAPANAARDWFVSPSGNDDTAGVGTAAAPFRTIARALAAMSPGDRCVLCAGTYREELLVDKPGLTLAAAPGERVLLTGCDELGTDGWTPLRIPVTGVTVRTAPTPARVWQLFLDGAPAPLARFPDKTADALSLADWDEAELDADAPHAILKTAPADRPDDFWRAGIYVGLHHYRQPLATWLTVGGRVAASQGNALVLDPAQLTFGFNTNNGKGAGFGYIIDCLNALDAPGEWCWSDGTLHLLPPAGGMPSRVEAQTRLFILRASVSASGLVLQGLNFKAGAVDLAGNNPKILGCTFRYASPFQHVADPSGKSNWGASALGASGVNITGNDAEVRDSYFGRTWWSGLTLAGNRALVENCVVEDCNWMGRRCGAIQAHGDDNTIRRCTIRRTGASAIEGGNFGWLGKYARRALWERNLCEDVGCLVVDQGFFYVNHQGGDHEPADSEWRFNRLHRYRGPDRGQWASTQVGLYTDNSSSGYKIHHNIVTGCREGIRYNDFHDDAKNGHDVWFCNNTFYQCATVFVRGVSKNPDGSPGHPDAALVLRNNLGLDCGNFVRAGTGNGTGDDDSNREFVPPTATGDFCPRAESGLVDAGAVVAGITDGFAGAAPDIGALEAGAEAWTAGATLVPPVFPDEPLVVLLTGKPVAVEGGRTSITAMVMGNPVPTIGWEVSKNGETWQTITSGAVFTISDDGKTLVITAATADMADWQFRFRTDNGAGGWITSRPVMLTVMSDTFENPTGLCADAAGNLYVADASRHVIHRITGITSGTGADLVFAGRAGVSGADNGAGDTALFSRPEAIAAHDGVLSVADTGNNAVRTVTASGNTSTFAAIAAPTGIAIDAGGNVYVAESETNTIRRIKAGGGVETIAGKSGQTGADDAAAGLQATFNHPTGLALDEDGTSLYIADTGNHLIRRLRLVAAGYPAGTLAGMAGDGGWRDGDVAGRSLFNRPRGLAVVDGVLYVADSGNHAVRAIDLSIGSVTTVAGNPGKTAVPEIRDGHGADARFYLPSGLAPDTAKNLYVADSGNGAIRYLDLHDGNRVGTLILNRLGPASDGTGPAPEPPGHSSDGGGGGAPAPVFLAMLASLLIWRAATRISLSPEK